MAKIQATRDDTPAPTSSQEVLVKMFEAYKVQNPAKYELKKEEFARKLAAAK
jgi:hypothetical protein